jgi:hypothetical protein
LHFKTSKMLILYYKSYIIIKPCWRSFFLTDSLIHRQSFQKRFRSGGGKNQGLYLRFVLRTTCTHMKIQTKIHMNMIVSLWSVPPADCRYVDNGVTYVLLLPVFDILYDNKTSHKSAHCTTNPITMVSTSSLSQTKR